MQKKRIEIEKEGLYDIFGSYEGELFRYSDFLLKKKLIFSCKKFKQLIFKIRVFLVFVLGFKLKICLLCIGLN